MGHICSVTRQFNGMIIPFFGVDFVSVILHIKTNKPNLCYFVIIFPLVIVGEKNTL